VIPEQRLVFMGNDMDIAFHVEAVRYVNTRSVEIDASNAVDLKSVNTKRYEHSAFFAMGVPFVSIDDKEPNAKFAFEIKRCKPPILVYVWIGRNSIICVWIPLIWREGTLSNRLLLPP
jgi:hypothetical protein